MNINRSSETAHSSHSPISGKVASVPSSTQNNPVFTGSGKRVLLYSHDSFGLGHIRRSLNIAFALRDSFPDLSMLLLTGSTMTNKFSSPEGLKYVTLSPIVKIDDEKYAPRDGSGSIEETLSERSKNILETTMTFRPDLLLVDHSPLGLKGELKPTFCWLMKYSPSTVIALGMRDIFDDPPKVRARWAAEGIYDTLDSVYNRIFIYGTQRIYDPVSEYGFPDSLANKSIYCDYVCENSSGASGVNTSESSATGSSSNRKLVVVTIGGGDYLGNEVIGTYLESLRLNKDKLDFDSVVITGPLVGKELLEKFRRSAEGLPVEIHQFVPGARSYFERSDFVIATGGYNTSVEVLKYAQRALIIPRVAMRAEQFIRAKRLASLGLVRMALPNDITPDSLFRDIQSELSSPRSPLAEAREQNLINFNGAENVARLCGELIQSAKNG
ncbi:MAG: hypothetical protein IIB00_07760 [candidate division Zixibacteria bacterium]|nr:hypothetical protein [candidate division Zixibacteria bacterium]